MGGIETLLEQIEADWSNQAKLSELTLAIVKVQLETASLIASAETEQSQAILAELEDQYKQNITKAKTRIKAMSGSGLTRLQYQFEAINSLLSAVFARITFLEAQPHPGQLQVQSPE